MTTVCDRLLVLLFVLTLPLANPWVRGDGVGYYAFARAILIEHRLDFEKDWRRANESFRMARLTPSGEISADQYTSTGHLANHFSVGPAILWSPLLIAAHLGVLIFDGFGGHTPADGFSSPYTVAMALGTAIYGFLAIWISFRLARKHLSERWAFLAALGIWFASSLPVYMYFNPSWSPAHSAFLVALFVWYWDRTRFTRTLPQWVILGLIAGLMLDVYYINGILILFPLLESLVGYWNTRKALSSGPFTRLFVGNLLFTTATILAFLPTLITKKVIYGSYFTSGYERLWDWAAPAILKVCYSSEHGLFSWTPILLLAVAGLFFIWRADKVLGLSSIAVFAGFLYILGCYESWHGSSSFGNRYFIPLTVLFVVGLARFFVWLARTLGEGRAAIVVPAASALLVLWNLGLIFQWGTHLIPARGPISWRDAAYNQVAVVPVMVTHTLEVYFMRRKQLMYRIEEQDVKQQLKSEQSDKSE